MTIPSPVPQDSIRFEEACRVILHALLRGLSRLIEYNNASKNSPVQLQYVQLQSAIDHLGRGVATSWSNRPYFERIDAAPPEMLAKVLAECGYTLADVEQWRTQFPEASLRTPPQKEIH